jgi:hypothetical protein
LWKQPISNGYILYDSNYAPFRNIERSVVGGMGVKNKTKQWENWGCGLVAVHLPSMCKTLKSIPSTVMMMMTKHRTSVFREKNL